jgi:hypothetical protein
MVVSDLIRTFEGYGCGGEVTTIVEEGNDGSFSFDIVRRPAVEAEGFEL